MGAPSDEGAVGLAARRPSPDRQLLRARRSGRDDAGVLRLRTRDRDDRQIQGPDGAARRADARARVRQRADRGAAREGDPPGLEDRQQQRQRSVEGQRDARLRRRARLRADRRAAVSAARSRQSIHRQHGRGAREGEAGGSAAPSRRHVFRVDWRHRAGQRVLLPHPQPGDPDRVRSPDAGRDAPRRARIRRRRSRNTSTP